MNLRTTNSLCFTMRDLYNKSKLTTYEYTAFTTLCTNIKSEIYIYNREKEIFDEKEIKAEENLQV